MTWITMMVWSLTQSWISLGSILQNKARRGDAIPAKLLQILKDAAVKMLHSMSVNSEISPVAIELEKVSLHSNPKERQCQTVFELPYNCIHFTYQQGYAQNPARQASAVPKLRTSRCTSWVQNRQRNQRSNCQHPLDHGESKGVPEKHLLLLH